MHNLLCVRHCSKHVLLISLILMTTTIIANVYIVLTGASLIAQLVKNLPAMQEIPVRIPGSGRSPGEQIDYPLQYSWASLVAQLIKNPPAMQETWV